MRLKNKIAVILCTAATAVSFLYPFSGAAVHAEQSEAALSEQSDTMVSEQTKQGETDRETQEAQKTKDGQQTAKPEGQQKTENLQENQKGETEAEQETGKTETEKAEDLEKTEMTEEDEEAKKAQEGQVIKGTEEAEAAEKEIKPEEAQSEKTGEEQVPEGEQMPEEQEAAEQKEEKSEETQESSGQNTELLEEMQESDELETETTEEVSGQKCTWTMPEFVEVRNIPVTARRAAGARSIGIASSRPQAGQQNRYEYTGGIQTFTVPQDGYYDICCYGSEGGSTYESHNVGKDKVGSVSCTNGGKGNMRSGRALLKKGAVLTITVAPRGSSKTFVETEDYCKDHDVNWAGGVGNSGEPSYIVCGGVTILSASGGNAGGMDVYAHPCNGNFRMDGDNRAGNMAMSNAGGNVVWQNQSDASRYGINGGNGLVTVTLVRLTPTLVLTASTEDWTNGDITLTADNMDNGAILPEDCLSWETNEAGNSGWTKEASHTVSQNGTYTCKIRNTDGDMTQVSRKVSNIDRLAPAIWLKPSESTWTSGEIVLEAVGEDREATAADGSSGLQEKAFLWGQEDASGAVVWAAGKAETADSTGTAKEAGQAENSTGTAKETGRAEDGMELAKETEQGSPEKENWADTRTFTVSRNGTYHCLVRDKAGNVKAVSYKVGNIDCTPPQVTYHKKQDKWYEGSLSVVLEAKDLQPDGTEGCGLDEAAYSTDGVHFNNQAELEITGEGVWTIWVKDRLGNVKKAEFAFYYDKRETKTSEETKPEDSKGGGHGGKRETFLPVISEIVPLPETEEQSINETSHSTEAEIVKYEPEEEKTVRRKTEIPVLEAPEAVPEEEPEREQKREKLPVIRDKKADEPAPEVVTYREPEKKTFNWKKAALYSVWMAVVFCGLIWLLFCLIFEHVTVYRRDDDGKYCKIGRCAIIRKKDYKQIQLIHLMKKEEERDYKIRFASAFVFLYKKDKVLIRTWHGVELRNVEKEIEILACNY